MPVPPLRELIYGAPAAGKTTALVARAANMCGDEEQAGRMLALSTEGRAVQRLRMMFDEHVGGSVPTADVLRRAVSLLEQFPQAAGLRLDWKSTAILSALDRRYLMSRAWASVGDGAESLYARYGDAPGALDWLARAFDQFAQWSGTADPQRLVLAPQDAALDEAWRCYRAYLHMCQQWGLVTFQEVLPRVLDLLRDEQIAARVRPDVLLLDDLDLFRPAALLFARALAGEGTQIVATSTHLPSPDDPEPAMRLLHRWCFELGMRPVEAQARSDTHVQPVLHAHGSVEDEAAAVAREVAAAVREGVAASECAVVLFDEEVFAPLRRACARHGLRVEGGERRDAYTLALAPLLVMGMRLIAGEACAPSDLVTFLRHPLLTFPAGDLHLVGVAVDGMGVPRMVRDDDPLRVLRQVWSPESSEEGTARLERIVQLTTQAREASTEPSLKLRAWLSAVGVDVRASAWSAQVLEPWAVDADDALLERWLAFLEQAEQVRAAVGEPLSDHDAVGVLEASQELVEPITAPTSDALQVWSPQPLGGRSARRVWLLGLHERALPAPAVVLPWVPPAAYAAAFGTLPGFVPVDGDDRTARWAEAERTLARAVGRARDRATLSWSTTGSDGRRRLRSPLLREMPVHPVAVGVDSRPPSGMQTGIAGPSLAEPRQIYRRSGGVFSTSPSAIENYLRCPRQYFYARELHLYDVVSSPRQAFGQLVHAALRDLHHRPDALPAALIDAHWRPVEGRFGTRLRAAAFREMALDAVQEVRAWDAERRSTAHQFVAAEAQFCWRMAPDLELRGTIDRIDRGPHGLSVIDYKLGAKSPSINDLLAMFVPPVEPERRAIWRPSDLQLPLYALAIEHGAVEGHPELASERIDEIGLIYPLQFRGANGKPSATGRRMVKIRPHDDDCTVCAEPLGRSPTVGEICRAQLDEVLEQALAVVGAMQSGIIDPAPVEGADTCRACAFRTICPEPQA
jgi:hypothetical protein